VFYHKSKKEIESMEQVIESNQGIGLHDIVGYEDSEWEVFWPPVNGLVELVENNPRGLTRNTVAWLDDVKLIRKAPVVSS
jgi:hypothetical protein